MSSDSRIEARSCAPKRTMSGWRCARWQSQAQEWFCGECGALLPPVAFALSPATGASGEAGAAQRRIALECEAVTALDEDAQDDFLVGFECTDPEESLGEIPLPLTRNERTSETPVALRGASGDMPFDLDITVRHRARADGAVPVLTGFFDYSPPTFALASPGPVAVPPVPGAFTIWAEASPLSSLPEAAELIIEEYGVIVAVATTRSDAGICLAFDPAPAEWAQLARFQAKARGTLSVRFRGVAEAVGIRVAVERRTPSQLTLELARQNRAMAGRRARIGAAFRNEGGAPARIEEVRWELRDVDGNVAATGALAEFVGLSIAAQDELVRELRPTLSRADDELKGGQYQLQVTIHYQDEAENSQSARQLEKSTAIEIVPTRSYPGIVCIDFGTTATAAAALPSVETSYFLDPLEGAVPQPIELCDIRPNARPDASNLFLPTIAAAGFDGANRRVLLYAEEVGRSGAALEHLRRYDRLKWLLDEASGKEDGQAPRDAEAITSLVVAYLKRVKALVEDHPSVAATIDTVVATRPARAGPAMERALVDVFLAAGMQIDRTDFGPGAGLMVSESWPPVLFTLPFPERAGAPPSSRLLEPLRSSEMAAGFSEHTFFDLDAIQQVPHFLCTFDIGGGSTDISLLEVEAASDCIRVRDLVTFTDKRFAGEGFRDLIVRTLDGFLPAPGLEEGPDGAAARLTTLRTIADAIKYFPDGPFRPVRSSAERMLNRMADLADNARAALFEWAREEGRAQDRLMAPAVPAAADLLIWVLDDLAMLPGLVDPRLIDALTPLGWPVDEDQGTCFRELIARIMILYFEAYSREMERYFQAFAQHWDTAADDNRVRVMITGRGSLFALNDSLITWHSHRLGIQTLFVDRVAGDAAKAVTSWGGATLVASARIARMLEFRSIGGEGYWVYGQSSLPKTFISAALQAVPENGDKWRIAVADLPEAFDRFLLLRVTNNLSNDTLKSDATLPVDLKALRARGNAVALEYDASRNSFLVIDLADPSGEE